MSDQESNEGLARLERVIEFFETWLKLNNGDCQEQLALESLLHKWEMSIGKCKMENLVSPPSENRLLMRGYFQLSLCCAWAICILTHPARSARRHPHCVHDNLLDNPKRPAAEAVVSYIEYKSSHSIIPPARAALSSRKPNNTLVRQFLYRLASKASC